MGGTGPPNRTAADEDGAGPHCIAERAMGDERWNELSRVWVELCCAATRAAVTAALLRPAGPALPNRQRGHDEVSAGETTTAERPGGGQPRVSVRVLRWKVLMRVLMLVQVQSQVQLLRGGA